MNQRQLLGTERAVLCTQTRRTRTAATTLKHEEIILMCSIWNRMAAMSVVDSQDADLDLGQDILKLKALEKLLCVSQLIWKKKN